MTFIKVLPFQPVDCYNAPATARHGSDGSDSCNSNISPYYRFRSWRAFLLSEYKPLNEILEILETRGLQVPDRATAIHYLSVVGHYRFAAFYKAFYSHPKAFDTQLPARLEDVVGLYSFDRRLRLLIIGPLEKIEVALRSLIIKEIGDYLNSLAPGQPVTINLFDRRLYDLTTSKSQRNYELAKDACKRSAWTHWMQTYSRSPTGRTATTDQRTRDFNIFYAALPAWAILHTASFGPLTHIFSILRPEISVSIARHFGLPRAVLTTTFYALKELRNSCAHHEPIWDWNARTRSVQLLFPRAFVDAAKISNQNRDSLYAYCSIIHILLSFLSNKHSTWYKRLKKLINEYNTAYSTAMGFPPDWQTMPFWCVPDVAETGSFSKLRSCFER